MKTLLYPLTIKLCDYNIILNNLLEISSSDKCYFSLNSFFSYSTLLMNDTEQYKFGISYKSRNKRSIY